MSHTSGPVVVSKSQAYGSPLTKLFWKQRKSKMSQTPAACAIVSWLSALLRVANP